MLTQKLTLAEKRTHRLFLKSFELQQLHVSTPALIQRLNWVANERAKQGKSSATKIVKNKGWMRWKSAVENHATSNSETKTSSSPCVTLTSSLLIPNSPAASYSKLFLCRLDTLATAETSNTATGYLATGCFSLRLDSLAREKRCRINLCKRHRFAIAISKYHLLVNSSLRLDFLLYDVASLLRLDVQATCWYLATALSNHLLIMMTSPMTSSTLNHLLILQPDVASSLSFLFSSADCFLLNGDITADVIYA
ncbi:hypothetical protein F511_41899 [Dorcoceras hygrometricum]|uniref:Uncharacterized protein n=1 Tax=Dorcoceras hygrometricum TaxID=472368 RepID=A0A2Z7CFG3_9LAMI|nr:hypothetical protein F511_41899 [Dorcoceras hygrometricum]